MPDVRVTFELPYRFPVPAAPDFRLWREGSTPVTVTFRDAVVDGVSSELRNLSSDTPPRSSISVLFHDLDDAELPADLTELIDPAFSVMEIVLGAYRQVAEHVHAHRVETVGPVTVSVVDGTVSD